MGELSDYVFFKSIGGNFQYPQMPPNFPAFLVDAVLNALYALTKKYTHNVTVMDS